MNEQKLAELHPKYTPAELRKIAAEIQNAPSPGLSGAADCSDALPMRAEVAWREVTSSRQEWTYADWEDFYDGITGAFQKIAARRQHLNAKLNSEE